MLFPELSRFFQIYFLSSLMKWIPIFVWNLNNLAKLAARLSAP